MTVTRCCCSRLRGNLTTILIVVTNDRLLNDEMSMTNRFRGRDGYKSFYEPEAEDCRKGGGNGGHRLFLLAARQDLMASTGEADKKKEQQVGCWLAVDEHNLPFATPRV